MSVLIKGMKMPTNCADCPLNYDQMACGVTGTRWWSDSMVMFNFDSNKERLQDCPLTEVPTPHGRLIDADALQDYNVETFGQRLLIIDTAPTVIEAED